MKPRTTYGWLGAAALAFFVFLRITRELFEGELGKGDSSILMEVAKSRSPWLTIAVVDITALGSVTIVTLFTALALTILLRMGDRMGALQLLASSMGAGVLILGVKQFVERARPEVAPQLVAATGFSYPSGHSLSSTALYLTLAIVASRHLRRSGDRLGVFAGAGAVILAVAASRVYLGVHYLTDVASGMALGAGWSLLLAGLFGRFWRHEKVLVVDGY